jgi:phosphopantetheinyl transferase
MLVINETLNSTNRLGVWRIDEDEEYFLSHLQMSPTLLNEFEQLHPRHRCEWLASRWLLAQMCHSDHVAYTKDEYGKPHLPTGTPQFSISHTRGYGAVLLGDQPVGIDIQALDKKMLRVRDRVVGPQEVLPDPSDEDRYLLAVHFYWGAKEALYKAWGKRQIDAIADMQVEPFTFDPNGGIAHGFIRKGSYFQVFQLHYRMVGNCMMVAACPIT